MDEEREGPAQAPGEEHPLEGGQGAAIDRTQEAEAATAGPGHDDAHGEERLDDGLEGP